MEVGFVVVPGAGSAKRIAEIGIVYDELMLENSRLDFKAVKTTDRKFFAESRILFEHVYQHPALLIACAKIIGRPLKLSSLLGRSVRANTPAQHLHTDIARDSADLAMAGFILTLDAFTPASGATRFIPGSQGFQDVSRAQVAHSRSEYAGEVLATGDAGSLIIFDAAVWHGHAANTTPQARRSIQGYFVRCAAAI